MIRDQPQTRIQIKNRAAILEAALNVFSRDGYRGATLDQIASSARLSKPNLLYYFPSKEAIHVRLLSELMDAWLAPLQALDGKGDPVDEIVGYALRKLEMARDMPRQSRLFANEIVQGAPRFLDHIQSDLRPLVDEKCQVIQGWVDTERIVSLDPMHLIFSIWATTQHYADFDVQVRALLQPKRNQHFDDAAEFLEKFYRRALTVS